MDRFFSPGTLPAAAAAAACTVLAAGCFDRDVPDRQVVARSVEAASTNAAAVTFLDLHVSETDSAPFEFPGDLASFPALERLSVRGRRGLSGVPDSVAAAKGLSMLDLADTGVSSLPDSLASIPALRQLYLSDNGLAAVPPVVSRLPALEYLNLDRNAIESLPDDIGGLASLKWLRLNGNRISGLPESAGTGWRSIRRLYLRGNGLKEVPKAVLSMESLEELDLGDNDIGKIPPELCRLPNLRRLDLDGNANLAALPENVGEMKALTHLFVYRCALPTNEQARVRAALPDRVRQFIAF